MRLRTLLFAALAASAELAACRRSASPSPSAVLEHQKITRRSRRWLRDTMRSPTGKTALPNVVYTADLSRVLIRPDGRPLLIECALADITVSKETARVRCSATITSFPERRLVLDLQAPKNVADVILSAGQRHGFGDLDTTDHVVVASIASVSAAPFQAAVWSEGEIAAPLVQANNSSSFATGTLLEIMPLFE
jgi:hypothetical protein